MVLVQNTVTSSRGSGDRLSLRLPSSPASSAEKLCGSPGNLAFFVHPITGVARAITPTMARTAADTTALIMAIAIIVTEVRQRSPEAIEPSVSAGIGEVPERHPGSEEKKPC